MNDTTQKIAAEAWEEIIKRKLKYDMGDRAQFDSDCIAIIQSAIEKAYNTGLSKGYWKRNAEIVSAAHASELKLESLTMTRTPEEQAKVERFPETFTDEQGQVWEELTPAQKGEQGAESLLDWAWTILANAGGGDWTKESPDWQEAVAKWRDEYHKNLSARRAIDPQCNLPTLSQRPTPGRKRKET